MPPRFDLPTPDEDTQPFWDGANAHKLVIKRCNACREYHHYPRPFCPKCWSPDVEWFEASGRATLYTWSVVYVNELGEGDIETRVQQAYGLNYARLAALKSKYDPDNIFRFNANIKPAVTGQAAPAMGV